MLQQEPVPSHRMPCAVSLPRCSTKREALPADRERIIACTLTHLALLCPRVTNLHRPQVTKSVKDDIAGDLERKLHAALDDALATIRGEVRRDTAPIQQDVKAIKAKVGLS